MVKGYLTYGYEEVMKKLDKAVIDSYDLVETERTRNIVITRGHPEFE